MSSIQAYICSLVEVQCHQSTGTISTEHQNEDGACNIVFCCIFTRFLL